MTSRLKGADLEALIAAVSDASGIPQRILAKDYWATEVLRGMANDCDGTFLFKGGTSLSKGYHLLDRYSEDIDLLVLADPSDAAAVGVVLDAIHASAVRTMGSPGTVVEKTRSDDGLCREISVSFVTQTRNVPGVEKTIRLEPGVRGGPAPRERVEIRSLLAERAPDELRDRVEAYDDGRAFSIDVLHPVRTLVEKLLAVHGLAVALHTGTRDKVPSRFARHFYDLHQLCLPGSAALTYLERTGGFDSMLDDAIDVTNRWFTSGTPLVVPPGGLTQSPAFTDPALRLPLEAAYVATCAELCYPSAMRPTWDEMLRSVASAAPLLS